MAPGKKKAEQKQLVPRRHEFLGDVGGSKGPCITLCSPAVKGPLSCCWPEGYLGDSHQGSVLLYVELV